MTFKENVIHGLKKTGMNQKELCEKAEITEAGLSRVLNKGVKPQARTSVMIQSVLEKNGYKWE